MSRYRLTPKARADLLSIWSYIALDTLKLPIAWNRRFTMHAHFWPNLLSVATPAGFDLLADSYLDNPALSELCSGLRSRGQAVTNYSPAPWSQRNPPPVGIRRCVLTACVCNLEYDERDDAPEVGWNCVRDNRWVGLVPNGDSDSSRV
jgi:hypothetical protein